MNKYEVSALRLRSLAERYPRSTYAAQLTQILHCRRKEVPPHEAGGAHLAAPGFPSTEKGGSRDAV